MPKIVEPKYADRRLYDECQDLVSTGYYYRIDCNASVPGDIADRLGSSFKYAVVLASTLTSTPEYFEHNPDLKPEGPLFMIRITRDDSSHGMRHENTDEKIVWKTKSDRCLYTDKKPKSIPDHRVDYSLFDEILTASPLRVMGGKPAPKPPEKLGTWKEYHDRCASLNERIF